MELGDILVIIALGLAIVAAFIDRPIAYRLLAASVVVLAIGVLVGVGGGLNTR